MKALRKLAIPVALTALTAIAFTYSRAQARNRVPEQAAPVELVTGIIDGAANGAAVIVLVPAGCVDSSLHVIPSCMQYAQLVPEWWAD